MHHTLQETTLHQAHVVPERRVKVRVQSDWVRWRFQAKTIFLACEFLVKCWAFFGDRATSAGWYDAGVDPQKGNVEVDQPQDPMLL